MPSITDTIDRPIDQVWAMISDFGGLMRWHPGISSCVAEGSGIGSIRVVKLKDRQVTERLDVLDARRHILGYTVTLAADPKVIGSSGRIELAPAAANQTRIRWRFGWPEDHPNASEVNARLLAHYPTRIGHLKQALSTRGE